MEKCSANMTHITIMTDRRTENITIARHIAFAAPCGKNIV